MATPNTTFTAGQVLTAAKMNNLPFGFMAGVRSTTATSTPTNPTAVSFLSTSAFTPLANRIYRLSFAVGIFQKNGAGFNQIIKVRVGSTSGTVIDRVFFSGLAAGTFGTIAKVSFVTTAQLGTTSATSLFMTVETNGSSSDSTFDSTTESPSILLIEDIGIA